MTDFLDEKRREITDRLAELKPLIDEYTRLEAAATALAGVGGSWPAHRATAARRRGPGRRRLRPAATAHRAANAGRSGRRTTGCTAQVGRPPQKSRPPRPPKKWPTRGHHRGCPAAPRRRRADVAKAVARVPLRPCRSSGTARHHDPRAGRQDGHQAELPLPRPARLWSRKRRLKKQGRGWHPSADFSLIHDNGPGVATATPGRFVVKGTLFRSAPGSEPCRARSLSSATDASIFEREKASMSRPCTIDHSPPRRCTGSR